MKKYLSGDAPYFVKSIANKIILKSPMLWECDGLKLKIKQGYHHYTLQFDAEQCLQANS